MQDDVYKDRLILALEAAGLDLWENNLITGEVPCKASKTLAELGYGETESDNIDVSGIMSLVHPDDVAHVTRSLHEHLHGASAQYRCEFRLKAKNGEWRWYANYGRIVEPEPPGRRERLIGVTFNIHDRKQQEEALQIANRKLAEQNAQLEEMNRLLVTLASTDELTGMANRHTFMEAGAAEVQRALRMADALSLLIIDIDFFKAVNDTYGHAAGDEAIAAIAHTLVHGVRQNVDLVGRIGGEEFAVLLVQTNSTAAMELAERLNKQVEAMQICIHDNTLLRCTVSIGVANLKPEHGTLKHLLIAADKALYQAKSSGRNRVCLAR